MKQTVTLAMVMSLDGKTTKWDQSNIHAWTSVEDRLFFSSLLQEHTAVIMGRKTFFVEKAVKESSSPLLRIVYSKDPTRYQSLAVKDQLEFTNDPPLTVCRTLKERGHENILVIGGSEINHLFLEAGIVNNVCMTIEPHLFGQGSGAILPKPLSVELKLLSANKLNEQGTLVLKYCVQKSISL